MNQAANTPRRSRRRSDSLEALATSYANATGAEKADNTAVAISAYVLKGRRWRLEGVMTHANDDSALPAH